MALKKTMTDALNAQFNEEYASAYLYESMAADFYAKNLPGFGVWMTKQAAEERGHAEKFHRYLDEHGERVVYGALAAPQASWDSPLAAMKAALAHEKHITQRIHDLVKLARSEGDIATELFLGWYVGEQVEEESNAQSLIDKLGMVGDNKVGLYGLDKEVAARQ
jgi:ferritin